LDYISFAKEFLDTLLVHTVATVRVPGRPRDNHAINGEVLNQSAISELFQNYMKLVKVLTGKGEVDPVHTGETAPDNQRIRWWVATETVSAFSGEKSLVPYGNSSNKSIPKL
jgi:hypothetical protein